MPRKTQEEVIADLEAKLAEAKAKASTRVDEQLAKIRERIDALILRKAKIDEQIEGLQKEHDELAGTQKASNQDELPVEDEQPELVKTGKGAGRAKPDAA